MAPPADYFQRYDLTDGDSAFDRSGDNVREDFLAAIYNIAPTQTPFMSGIGRGSSSDILTSWQQDDLAEPDDTNAALDGADIGADQSSKAARVGNVNQISTKSIIVSGRADAVDKAGRGSELSYQLAKASKALKRDMEAILTGNQAAAVGDASTNPSKLGGLRACFRDAVTGESETALTAGDGANGGTTVASNVYVPAAATDGTVRALTESDLRTAIRGCYENGGEPDTIMVSPAMKQALSEYLYTSSARVAAMYSDVGQKRSDGGAAVQGAVDVYISDFGALKIVPNRFQGYDVTTTHAPRNRDVFVLDMSLWGTLFLRPFRTIDVARSGDSKKKLLLVDYSLQFKQEMGSGGVFDIDHTAAVTP